MTGRNYLYIEDEHKVILNADAMFYKAPGGKIAQAAYPVQNHKWVFVAF